MPDLNVVNFFRIAKSNGTEFIAGMKQFVELIESESSAGLDSILPILNAHPSLANLDAAAIAKLKVLANFTSKVSAEMLANVSKYIRAIELTFSSETINGTGIAGESDSDILKGFDPVDLAALKAAADAASVAAGGTAGSTGAAVTEVAVTQHPG